MVKLYNVRKNSILDRLCSFSPWTLALPGTQFDYEWRAMQGFLSTLQRTGITSCILLIQGLCLRFVSALSLGRSGYYPLFLVSERHGCDNVKPNTCKNSVFKSTRAEENESGMKFYVEWSLSCVLPVFPLKNPLFFGQLGDHNFPFIIMASYFKNRVIWAPVMLDVSQFNSIRLHQVVIKCCPRPHYGRQKKIYHV